MDQIRLIRPSRVRCPALRPQAGDLEGDSAECCNQAADGVPSALWPMGSHSPPAVWLRVKPVDQCILLIEDDTNLARLIEVSLRREGYRVLLAEDGVLGLETAEREHPDLVILDIMLPGLDGWEVCRRLKAASDIPVLMLTARVTEDDVLKGFSCGADDYLRKPFSLAELRARVASLLRRAGSAASGAGSEPKVLTNLDLVLDTTRHEVHKQGRPLGLTPKEYRLLAYFLRHPGRLLSYEELLTQVWGPEHKDQSVYLRVYVRYLRQKLGDDPSRPTYITNVRGEGYRFREP